MLTKKLTKYISVIMLTISASFISSLSCSQTVFAIIDTSKGEITVKLNERAAPTSVANFANLAQRGFYDGLSFLINNFNSFFIPNAVYFGLLYAILKIIHKIPKLSVLNFTSN